MLILLLTLLHFIDATLSNGVSIGALATVSGDVDLGHYGDVSVTTLTSVSSLTFSNSTSITALTIDGLASGDLGTYNFPLATSIVLGDIALNPTAPATVTATLATTFTSGFDGTLGDISFTTSGVAVVRLSATKIVGTVPLQTMGLVLRVT